MKDAHAARTERDGAAYAVRPIIVDAHGVVQSAPAVTIQAIVQQPPSHDWLQVAKDWQSLEAGALAIIAALIGACALYGQTKTNIDLEKARLSRQLRARRAVLPLTLSSLHGWSDACGRSLLRTYHQANGSAVLLANAQNIPRVPPEAVPSLERFVEACDEAGAVSVSNLIGDIQIFEARTQSFGLPSSGIGQRNVLCADIESHLIGIGTIAAQIGTLFDYSRRRSEETKARPNWDEVRSALSLMRCDPLTEPNLFTRIAGRETQGRQPGFLA